jgi:hypothetical protein
LLSMTGGFLSAELLNEFHWSIISELGKNLPVPFLWWEVLGVVSICCVEPRGRTLNSSCWTRRCVGKAIPLQAWTDPECSRRLRFLDFMTIGTWRW